MFTYLIGDKNKTLVFNGKKYYTPCSIPVKGIVQIDQLNLILNQNNITKVSVQGPKKIKTNKTLTRIPVIGVEGTISLSTVLGGHSSSQMSMQIKTGTTSILNH